MSPTEIDRQSILVSVVIELNMCCGDSSTAILMVLRLKVAVVMIGTNNIGHRDIHTTSEVLAGVQAVVRRIHESESTDRSIAA